MFNEIKSFMEDHPNVYKVVWDRDNQDLKIFLKKDPTKPLTFNDFPIESNMRHILFSLEECLSKTNSFTWQVCFNVE